MKMIVSYKFYENTSFSEHDRRRSERQKQGKLEDMARPVQGQTDGGGKRCAGCEKVRRGKGCYHEFRKS